MSVHDRLVEELTKVAADPDLSQFNRRRLDRVLVRLRDYYRVELRESLSDMDRVQEIKNRAAELERKIARRSRRVRPSVRLAVFARDGLRCRYCGGQLTAGVAQLDHYEPDGPGEANNLVTACGDCNRRKSNTRPRSLRRKLGMRLQGGKPETVPAGWAS